MQVGNIVVVNTTAPARFRNLKPGSLWKVVRANGYGGGDLAVGDQNHASIRTLPQYFDVVDSATFEQASKDEGTDLAIRLGLIDGFGPKSVFPNPADRVAIKVNGGEQFYPRNLARSFAQKNTGKLVQRKLRQALGI